MEKYEARVGALYKGILFKKHWLNKFVTVIFIFKRIAFVVTFFYCDNWHLEIFLATTTINLVYLMFVQPFEDHIIWRLEAFNEVITWLLIVTL